MTERDKPAALAVTATITLPCPGGFWETTDGPYNFDRPVAARCSKCKGPPEVHMAQHAHAEEPAVAAAPAAAWTDAELLITDSKAAAPAAAPRSGTSADIRQSVKELNERVEHDKQMLGLSAPPAEGTPRTAEEHFNAGTALWNSNIKKAYLLLENACLLYQEELTAARSKIAELEAAGAELLATSIKAINDVSKAREEIAQLKLTDDITMTAFDKLEKRFKEQVLRAEAAESRLREAEKDAERWRYFATCNDASVLGQIEHEMYAGSEQELTELVDAALAKTEGK